MEFETDPWDWSIDQVVEEVCVKRSIWRKGRPNVTLPNPAVLEPLLRENAVDGATLLSGVGKDELKNEFRIKSLGHINGFLWGVGRLRMQSSKYHEWAPPSDYSVPGSGYQSAYSHRFSEPPRIPYSPTLPMIRDSPVTPLHRTENDDNAQAGASSFVANMIPEVPKTPVSEANATAGALPGSAAMGDVTLGKPASGRPRRRLDLTALRAPSTADTPEVGLRAQLSRLKPGSSSFLGANTFSVDDMFFGQHGLGQQINSDTSLAPLDDDGSSSEHAELFTSFGPSVHGRQAFVNRKMMYFLQKSELETVDHVSEDRLAIYPYSATAASSAESRSIIMIADKDGIVSATRENIRRLEQGDNTETESNPQNQDWDYLSHWHQEPGTEYPAYGDSEVDESELDSLEREMEEDAEIQEAKGQLDRDEVLAIIEKEVEKFIAKWKKDKLPIWQGKAFTLWKKGKTSRDRVQLAASAKQFIAHKTHVLTSKLIPAIIADVWTNSKPLIDLCVTLEETVVQREEEHFKMSVWQCSTLPAKSTAPVRTYRRRERHRDAEEHNLDSDDEIFDDRASLNDFMELDLVEIDLSTMPYDSPPNQGDEMQDIQQSGSGADSVLGQEQQENDTASEHGSATPSKSVKSETNPTAISKPALKKTEVIDLTLDDTSDEETPPDRTPPKNKSAEVPETSYVKIPEKSLEESPAKILHQHGRQTSTPAPRVFSNLSNDPRKSRDEDILKWSFDRLCDERDRIRLLIKLLRTLQAEPYQVLRGFVLGEGSTRTTRIAEISEFMFKILLKQLKEQKVDLIIARVAYEAVDMLLHLYACWFLVTQDYFMNESDLDTKLELAPINRDALKEIRETVDTETAEDLRTFIKEVYLIFKNHAHPIQVSDLERDLSGTKDNGIVVEDDEPDFQSSQELDSTPGKKRKRAVAESQVTLFKRANLKRSRGEWSSRKESFLRANETQSSELVAGTSELVINVGKEDHEVEIYIDADIAEKMKPHQVDGVRFMWREIVGTSDEDEDLQGCLLAHTMGLGKTMQVITLLRTLDAAAASPDSGVRSQIPRSLRKMKTLILCPPGLIDNWMDEFRKWSTIKPLAIQAMLDVGDRLAMLRSWHESKSSKVLLMGYNLFQAWVFGKGNALDEEEHAKVKNILIKGASLVIADEAHNMKNPNAKITQAARLLKTKSRVALTGSPLSNHLTEYYTTVDWIAPGYLGELVEFKANYVEPIEEGLYADSVPAQFRRSLVKLAALKSMLQLKIDRKEVTALRGSLKPKVEFVFKIPLTEVQTAAYTLFVETAQSGQGGKTINQARLWAWVACLQILCNHPFIFYQKLKQQEAAQKELPENQGKEKSRSRSPAKRQADEEDGLSPRGEGSPRADGGTEAPESIKDALPAEIASSFLTRLTDLFKPVLEAAYTDKYSVKFTLLLKILRSSIKVGDRTLVFSQTIATLDFLEKMLQNSGITYMRLDGNTKMHDRQDMIKDFNESGKYHVFLISTKAGGTGFNLHGANRVVLLDFSYNPTWEEQAIGRVYRFGQPKPVFVYRFVTGGTFEESLFNKSIYKMQLAYRVIEKKNTESMAERTRMMLAVPKPSQPEDLSEHKGKHLDSVLDDLLEQEVAGKEWIHGITTTETLQVEVNEALTEDEQREVDQAVAIETERINNPEKWRVAQLLKASVNTVPSTLGRFPSLSSTAMGSYTAGPHKKSVSGAMGPPASTMPILRQSHRMSFLDHSESSPSSSDFPQASLQQAHVQSPNFQQQQPPLYEPEYPDENEMHGLPDMPPIAGTPPDGHNQSAPGSLGLRSRSLV